MKDRELTLKEKQDLFLEWSVEYAQGFMLAIAEREEKREISHQQAIEAIKHLAAQLIDWHEDPRKQWEVMKGSK